MSGGSWQRLMLELLIAERRRGEVDFCRAWRHASAQARAVGVKRPRDFIDPERDDPGWLPLSAFFREACWREWHGLVRADFLGLRQSLEDGGLSASSPPDRYVPGSSRVRMVA